MDILAGRVALVTGASRGLGVFIAHALGRERMDLVLAARSAPELDALAGALAARGVRAIACAADVSREEDRARLVETAEREVGPIDVLVNNAGVEHAWAFERVDPEDLRRVIDVNLVAPMLLARLLVPGMLARGRGHVVNVSSLAGKSGPPFITAYAASKAGLIGLTESLRAELRPRGVSASVVCPGFVRDAGMFADSSRATGRSAPPLLGTVSPDAVADAVVRAVREDLPEILVAQGPMRLGNALAQLFPRMRDTVVERLGVRRAFGAVARFREKERGA